MFKEKNRQSIHISFLLFAFLFKYLNKWQVVVILLVLLFITVVVVPKMKSRNFLYRQFEKKYSQGAIAYFSTLIVLTLIFPLYIVAASWAVLSLGDGMATLIGKNFKAQELPWNKNKSYYGSLAFVFFATLGATILLKWMMPGFSLGHVFSIGLKASIVAAVVETLPWRFSDNSTVPIAAAVVVFLLT